METLDRMAREGDGRTVMLSCEIDIGIDWLLESIWRVSLILSSSAALTHGRYARNLAWSSGSTKAKPSPTLTYCLISAESTLKSEDSSQI